MECLFQLFQVFGGNGVVSGEDVVHHFGAFKEVGDDDRRVQVVVHGFVALGTQGFRIYRRGCCRCNLVQSMYGIHQSGQTLFGGLQGFVAEVHRAAVVRLQGEEADGHRAVCLFQHGVRAGEQLFQGDEVAVALAHFLSVHSQHVVVHPVVHHVVTL